MNTRVSRAVPNTVLQHLGVDSADKLIWTNEQGPGGKFVIVTAQEKPHFRRVEDVPGLEEAIKQRFPRAESFHGWFLVSAYFPIEVKVFINKYLEDHHL